MTSSQHLWDRAANQLVPADGRRAPQVPALNRGTPTVGELFDFMRDAELRFETLRMRIVELAWAAGGELRTETEVVMRHPGHARVLTTKPGEKALGEYEIWIADGDIVRTYSSRHKLGTQRPIRNRPRGLDDPDLPGASKVYEPLTALPTESLPETFIHPAGFCQNVLSTGACQVSGPEVISGRETIGLTCHAPADDGADRRPAGLHDPDRGRSRYRDHRAPRRDDRRRDHQGRPGRQTWSPMRCSSRRPSTSPSRRGRRCSTDGASRQPGSKTRSITWITPFDTSMSAAITWASLM